MSFLFTGAATGASDLLASQQSENILSFIPVKILDFCLFQVELEDFMLFFAT